MEKAKSYAHQRVLMAQGHAKKRLQDAKGFAFWQLQQAQGAAGAFAKLAQRDGDPTLRARLYREAMASIFVAVGGRVIVPRNSDGARIRIQATGRREHDKPLPAPVLAPWHRRPKGGER